MRPRSSNSARIISVDRDRVQRELQAAVRNLKTSHPEIEQVLLFGSWARGDYFPGSDLDLLIVLSEAEGRPLDRIPRYFPAGLSVPVDVFPYTRAELEERRALRDPFVCRALREGVEVLGDESIEWGSGAERMEV